MSLAAIATVTKSLKPGVCESCGDELPRGSAYLHFKVGFRSRIKHVRCTKPGCFPRPSQRESSLVADAYAAQEAAADSIATATGRDDLESIIEEVASAFRDVAQAYTDAADAMGTAGEEMTERADTIEAAADEIEQFDVTEYEVDPGDEGYDEKDESTHFQLEEAREALTDAINSAELP